MKLIFPLRVIGDCIFIIIDVDEGIVKSAKGVRNCASLLHKIRLFFTGDGKLENCRPAPKVHFKGYEEHFLGTCPWGMSFNLRGCNIAQFRKINGCDFHSTKLTQCCWHFVTIVPFLESSPFPGAPFLYILRSICVLIVRLSIMALCL